MFKCDSWRPQFGGQVSTDILASLVESGISPSSSHPHHPHRTWEVTITSTEDTELQLEVIRKHKNKKNNLPRESQVWPTSSSLRRMMVSAFVCLLVYRESIIQRASLSWKLIVPGCSGSGNVIALYHVWCIYLRCMDIYNGRLYKYVSSDKQETPKMLLHEN